MARTRPTASSLRARALTKFMGQLNDYLGFFEKVDKRIRNEEVSSLLAKLELVRRGDFESADGKRPPSWRSCTRRSSGMKKNYQFKDVTEPVLDEEHQTWSVSFTDAQGALRRIDWALAFGAGVSPDDGEACADQGRAGAAIPDRICGEGQGRPRKRRSKRR